MALASRISTFLIIVYFRFHHLVQFITGTYLYRYGNGYALSFAGCFHWFEVESYLVGIEIDGSGRRSGNKQLVTDAEFSSLDGKFSHTQFTEIFHTLAYIHLSFCSATAIMLVPFAQFLSLGIASPGATVEDGSEPVVPAVFLLFGESTVENTLDRLFVTTDDGLYILRSACPSS